MADTCLCLSSFLNGEHLYSRQWQILENKNEIQGYTNAQVCVHREAHTNRKTEEIPVLLLGLLGHGRSDESAHVLCRGCSKWIVIIQSRALCCFFFFFFFFGSLGDKSV